MPPYLKVSSETVPGMPPLPGAQRPVLRYIKPSILAFLLCGGFIGIANFYISAKPNAPVQQSKPLYEDTRLFPMESSMPQTDQHTFMQMLQERPNANINTTSAGTFVTVRLGERAVYRLYCESTYQELAVAGDQMRRQLMHQLDAQGIEYEVLKNTGGTALLCSGEWIFSWGGLLYLPRTPYSFSQTNVP